MKLQVMFGLSMVIVSLSRMLVLANILPGPSSFHQSFNVFNVFRTLFFLRLISRNYSCKKKRQKVREVIEEFQH